MIFKQQMDRERVAGTVIFISLFIILLSVISIRILDVKVTNIELVDKSLYTIITDKGPVNVDSSNILRIERTYAKAAITGAPVEMDRIYTTKGFIYFSSLEPFYATGQQFINSVDSSENPVWINSNISNAAQADWTPSQLQNANLKLIQPYDYAIGTPSNLVPVVSFIVFLQYMALAVGGTALFALIFPLRLGTSADHSFVQEDSELPQEEEKYGVVAK